MTRSTNCAALLRLSESSQDVSGFAPRRKDDIGTRVAPGTRGPSGGT